MASLWTRLTGGSTVAPAETKSAGVQSIFTATNMETFELGSGDLGQIAMRGFRQNPVVYRCVRMVCEAATSIPLNVRCEGETDRQTDILEQLLRNPNPHQSGDQLFEQIYAHLYTQGNAYVHGVLGNDGISGLYALRPDRITIEADRDGWPETYIYKAGDKALRFSQSTYEKPQILHLKLFDPGHDHFGLSPMSAAKTSFDTHDAAARWNKALLNNAARPSGALVYSSSAGNLTDAQFSRLKEELESGFQGATNAGRPMVLEGGLDWKSMALSPRDMDFIEAKNAAARDIALAFGVPPMLLGIPGDNTFANYAEANRSFWRQTIVPLVRRTADALNGWVAQDLRSSAVIVADTDAIDALAEDRNAKWQRINEANFLTDDEKRALLGLAPLTT